MDNWHLLWINKPSWSCDLDEFVASGHTMASQRSWSLRKTYSKYSSGLLQLNSLDRFSSNLITVLSWILGSIILAVLPPKGGLFWDLKWSDDWDTLGVPPSTWRGTDSSRIGWKSSAAMSTACGNQGGELAQQTAEDPLSLPHLQKKNYVFLDILIYSAAFRNTSNSATTMLPPTTAFQTHEIHGDTL